MNTVRFILAVPYSTKRSPYPVRVDAPTETQGMDAAFWASPETPVRRLAGSALALGTVFAKAPRDNMVRAIDAPASAHDHARILAREYWGAYVALLWDDARPSFAVMVDPSGLVPVFHTRAPGHHLFASDPSLLDAVPSYPDLFNHLLRPELRHRRTCLSGVAEVPPGALAIAAGHRVDVLQLWRPERFFPDGDISTLCDAAARLRECAIQTIGAWAGTFGKVAVATSGGVDSSLVCAALAHTTTAFECISLATSDRSGDERLHALAVANHIGVGCTSRLFDPAGFDPARSASAGLARPSRRAFLNLYDDAFEEARLACGAQVVLDGNMGDNLFCYLTSAAPVIDRLRAEGFGQGVIRTLVDMCRITGVSMPVMAMAVLRRLAGRGAQDPWPPDYRLINPARAADTADPLTPWLENWSARRDGRIDHLRLIMHAQNHLNDLAGPRRRFSPLASQPLVELCLGIDTWLWTEGGINRAVARRAFASDLPEPIVQRTSKSGPDSLIRFVFAKNRLVIAERLLDGCLAQHGLLDRAALEQALRLDEFRDVMLVERILDLLEAENWVRSVSR
jgi:asparagine synthase (glutamine-hydrolysing)